MRRIALRIFLFVLVFAVPFFIWLAPSAVAWVISAIVFLAPVWLPIILTLIAIPLWIRFVRSYYLSSVPFSVIELKPGPETPASARAMELALYALYHRNEVSRSAAFFQGVTRMSWSFEIYAHAGGLRFFIHLPTAHRAAVEARIRAEYRDVDIDLVRDYSREIPFDPLTMTTLVREYVLQKADPYPIKTYVSYEGEKGKTDAFNELLESLVGLGDGEHILLSFIVRPHQRERASFFGELEDSLHHVAQNEIGKLVGSRGDMRGLSPAVQKTVKAIEDSLKKPTFDCGVRALYVANNDQFKEERGPFLDSLLDPFNDDNLNGFRAYDPKENAPWPLSDVFAVAPIFSMSYFVNVFRRRSFFAPPYYGKPFILNTEELATVFHLPHAVRGSVLAGMHGTRLDPPENLPV